MSMTIESEDDLSAKTFIGEKPNMLNVAFTRAKQQLFIVGNFSVLENVEKTNYLYKTSEFIKEHGRLFSIYYSDTFDELEAEQKNAYLELLEQMSPISNTRYEEVFGPYLNSANIIEDDSHYNLLMSMFDNAESSVAVVCPWMTKSVVNETFIENVSVFKNQGKNYSIVFGYKNSKNTLNTREEIESIIKGDSSFPQNIEEAADRVISLKNIIGDNLIYSPPLHTKALIIDQEYLVIGSHNWLSKKGQRKGDREEMSIVVRDSGMIEYICKKFGIK